MAIHYEEKFYLIERRRHTVEFNSLPFHYHKTHELYYLESGRTKYFIGDELFILEPGDMIFIPKGVYHKTATDGAPYVERVVLSFGDEILDEKYQPYINGLAENKHIKFPQEQLHKIQDLIGNMEKEDMRQSKDFQEMLVLYLKQLLISISRYRDTENTSHLSETYTIIQNAAKYINTNCSSDLSLKTLAKMHAMSPNYFSKQFKLVTGIGLNEYINISRITAAEKLLTTTSLPISRIASECGFNDSNYFAAVFKKIKGITPKKYSAIYKKCRP